MTVSVQPMEIYTPHNLFCIVIMCTHQHSPRGRSASIKYKYISASLCIKLEVLYSKFWLQKKFFVVTFTFASEIVPWQSFGIWLGVRILCSKIRELCYALMLTIHANYAPQISHYAPKICHYASKQNNFLGHRPERLAAFTCSRDTCSPVQYYSCSNSQRHLPPSLQRLLHCSRLW